MANPSSDLSPNEVANLPFWSRPLNALLVELESGGEGLSAREARDRLLRHGVNSLKPSARTRGAALLFAQFNTPIILILIFAAVLSFVLRERTDAFIILVIVGISGLLGFWREKSASDAVAGLLALVQVSATVVRDGAASEISVEQIVPGDIVLLNAGDLVPGDGQIIECRDLFVDEATLTGETFPSEKSPGVVLPGIPLGQRSNSLFLGTHVVSGTAKMVVARTGRATEIGRLSTALRQRPGETEFEHGVRRFGYFLMEITFLLVLGIFAVNVYLDRPVLESLLFALALAIGLTPQLLPAIISVNLTRGATRMAARRVVVKRLAAIENFGSMTVLCSDKTGTLTEGRMKLECAVDVTGRESSSVLDRAGLNACFQTGYTNPMDAAILARWTADATRWRKLDEEPYDFTRRRMSVLIAGNGEMPIMITKGAVPNVLEGCSQAASPEWGIVELASVRAAIEEQARGFGVRGMRVLGVAYRALPGTERITKGHEAEMIFVGILAFSDPLRTDIVDTLRELRALGIRLKIVTGDHHLVALDVSKQAGFKKTRCLTGPDLRKMSDAALRRRVNEIDVFAEIEPNQKERLILALRHSGQVVGYLGDGINDAPALQAADVGISVADAVDIARQAADVVLLEKNLSVLVDGVEQGRATFANTSKYVFMATSANFGNMFSMAGASLFLPFLPLLPKQILLLNLLTDFPEMAIATDRVDKWWIKRPRRWNIKFIRRFMITFGLLSSVFDFATFALLRVVLHVDAAGFRSAWFIESAV
ncbi:MAG TPA: magnesium-translocating P-type ATPase, partial [Opitutus sp.]|nr:magnesium-translocating P-type ATPase [Opitutus sp.]